MYVDRLLSGAARKIKAVLTKHGTSKEALHSSIVPPAIHLPFLDHRVLLRFDNSLGRELRSPTTDIATVSS